jgi:hypothetical protein
VRCRRLTRSAVVIPDDAPDVGIDLVLAVEMQLVEAQVEKTRVRCMARSQSARSAR